MASRVDPETLSYLTDVSQRYAALADPEDRQLLRTNVLEEMQGKELRIATDAATSRMLEALLAGAHATELMQFLEAFSSEDALYKLAGGAFGSHVAENILAALDAQAGALDEAAAQQLQDLLGRLVGAVGDQLYEYIMDKHATHVARRLLCVIAGRDVLPPGKKPRKPSPADEAAGDAPHAHQQQQQQQQPRHPDPVKRKSALAEKLAGGAGAGARAGAPAVRYPALLRRFARMLPIYDVSGMSQLAKNTYSSPFVQGVLRAAASDQELLLQLLPPVLGAEPAAAAAAAPGSRLATIADSHVGKLMRDECYSRVMEVVVAVAPPELSEEIYSRFMKGRVLPLTSHHSANFVVQSALAACATPQQFMNVFGEIRYHLGDMLKKRRSGVMAAAVASALRLGCAQQAVADAVAAALGQLPQWDGRAGPQLLAPALLTLDTDTVLSSSSSTGATAKGQAAGRLSTPGCAVLATLLQYPPSVSEPFVASFTGLSSPALAHVASDPSGSRAVEALLAGPAPAEAKLALLQRLQGCWAQLALSAPGSYVVEAAFAWADMEGKERLVAEVAARLTALTQQCPWGPRLSVALGLEAYQRKPEDWHKHVRSASTTKAAFAQLFGGGQQQDPEQGQLSKRELRRQRKARKLARLQEQEQGKEEEEEEQQRQQQQQQGLAGDEQGGRGAEPPVSEQPKKRKKDKKLAAAAAAAAADELTELQPADEEKKKKRSKEAHADLAQRERGADDAADTEPRKKAKTKKPPADTTAAPAQPPQVEHQQHQAAAHASEALPAAAAAAAAAAAPADEKKDTKAKTKKQKLEEAGRNAAAAAAPRAQTSQPAETASPAAGKQPPQQQQQRQPRSKDNKQDRKQMLQARKAILKKRKQKKDQKRQLRVQRSQAKRARKQQLKEKQRQKQGG